MAKCFRFTGGEGGKNGSILSRRGYLARMLPKTILKSISLSQQEGTDAFPVERSTFEMRAWIHEMWLI